MEIFSYQKLEEYLHMLTPFGWHLDNLRRWRNLQCHLLTYKYGKL